MLLRVNGPILGRRNGDLIEVSDEAGRKAVADYGLLVTEIAERPKAAPLKLVPKDSVVEPKAVKPVVEAVDEPVDEPVADPTVDEILESLNGDDG